MGNGARLPRRAFDFAKSFLGDPLTHWPFPNISRQLYGNLSGFRQNLYGSVDTRIHKLAGMPGQRHLKTTAETRQQAENLRKTGLAIMKGWITTPTINQIRQPLLTAAQEVGKKPSKYIDILEANDFKNHVPEVFDIFNAKITNFLECYFGGHFLINSGAFRLTRHVPHYVRSQNEIYSDRWHTDSGPTSMLAIFVLLNDVSADSGPTSALNIKATKKAVRNGYRSRGADGPVIDAIESDPSRVEMIGPAGTVMFINVARCLHRAGIPGPGKRREWLQFRLFPSLGSTNATNLQPASILRYTNPNNRNY